MQKHAKTWWKMQKNAKTCKNMIKNAKRWKNDKKWNLLWPWSDLISLWSVCSNTLFTNLFTHCILPCGTLSSILLAKAIPTHQPANLCRLSFKTPLRVDLIGTNALLPVPRDVIVLIVKCDGCPNPFRQDRFRLATGHNNNDWEKTMDFRTFQGFHAFPERSLSNVRQTNVNHTRTRKIRKQLGCRGKNDLILSTMLSPRCLQFPQLCTPPEIDLLLKIREKSPS